MRWEYVAGIITAIGLILTPIVIEVIRTRAANRKAAADPPPPQLTVVQGQTVDYQAETMAAWKVIAADRQHAIDGVETDLRKANALLSAKDRTIADLREEIATQGLTITVLRRQLDEFLRRMPPPS